MVRRVRVACRGNVGVVRRVRAHLRDLARRVVDRDLVLGLMLRLKEVVEELELEAISWIFSHDLYSSRLRERKGKRM